MKIDINMKKSIIRPINLPSGSLTQQLEVLWVVMSINTISHKKPKSMPTITFSNEDFKDLDPV